MNLPAKLLACCSFALLIQGCIAPSPPPLPTQKPSEIQIDPWWQELNDASLNTLVNTIIKDNLSLQMAQQRVLQAYAILENKKASTLPSASLSGAKSYQDELKGVESKKESYTATLSASYEVDLFNKKRDAIQAQNATFQSTQEALHVTGISLVAELANAWYTLGYKQESLALLEEQFKVATTILTLTQLSFQNGTNSITDVWQQEQYIKNLEAQASRFKNKGDLLNDYLGYLIQTKNETIAFRHRGILFCNSNIGCPALEIKKMGSPARNRSFIFLS